MVKLTIDNRSIDNALSSITGEVEKAFKEATRQTLPEAQQAMVEAVGSMVGFLHMHHKMGLDNIFKPNATLVNDEIIASVERDIPDNKMYAYTQVMFDSKDAGDKVIRGRPALAIPLSGRVSKMRGDPIAYERGYGGAEVVRLHNNSWVGLKDSDTGEMLATLTYTATVKEKNRAPLYSIEDEIEAAALSKIVNKFNVTFSRLISSRSR